MSEKKHIDRLFQEKFKDFEAMPPADAWNNIEARLEDKKKRRIIPFWWKLSGVAAVFILGFFISQVIYNQDGNTTENAIVNQNNTDKNNASDSQTVKKGYPKNTHGMQAENPVVDASVNSKSNATDSHNKNNVNPSAVAASDKNEGSNAASTSMENKGSNIWDRNKSNNKAYFHSKSVVAEGKSAHNGSFKNKSTQKKNKTLQLLSSDAKQQNQLAQNTKGSTQQSDGNGIVQTDAKEKNNNEIQAQPDKAPINLDDLKGNVNSKIATKEIDKKRNDSVTANSIATNELEKLLNEKESKSKQESKMNRWQLTSNVAPVFLGSISGGSPIDSTLSRNSKSYNTNVGFGIGVSYALNRKLSIRTGLNKVNMSYDTQDITFFTGIQAKTLTNVNPAASSAMIHVESNVPSTSTVPSEGGLLPFENSLMHKSSGFLRQEMGYLEMPVEMTYNVLDKKFGVKIIGGFSTLFLQNNNILIISENRDTVLGKANNLNDVHFSTNFGLGVKYSFFRAFEFNVEPTVKYQLNTYSSNSGNFKPYLFGIYSGVSYKF